MPGKHRKLQLFRAACRQPRFGRFPMINGTLKKWRNLNKPPILQHGRFEQTTNPFKMEDLIRLVTYFQFSSINAPTKKRTNKATNTSFFCGEKPKILPARFTVYRTEALDEWYSDPWASGGVFPKNQPPVFPDGWKNLWNVIIYYFRKGLINL